ncbi:hypothetical protein [Caminibacter mediatlanticus]|uniref:Uncharacterized protein n=1 Tax=Caminibacter mediatlanticus TB-2 TaxID=391592 RepID=A0AAI9F2B7_9BACT|nr:hypothetical protein [Caminibacter mediatlanticus]EDM23643.1 hypothetical protein CMTB2_05142 [Caminibacter mediatlanticus TB-2]
MRVVLIIVAVLFLGCGGDDIDKNIVNEENNTSLSLEINNTLNLPTPPKLPENI